MKKIYKYRFFGSLVETNFSLDFLENIETPDTPDLKISFEKSPVDTIEINPLSSNFIGNLIYYKDSDENLFKISKDAIEIVSNEINFFNLGLSLIGIPIGYYFFLNNLQVLHGSAVSIKNKAICFVGQSSIGKSVISASLISKEVKFISEDLIILQNDFSLKKNANWVKLSQNLTSDNTNKMKASYPILKDKRNRFISLLDESLVQNESAKASLCYFPIWGESLEIRETNIKESFSFLLTNSYKQKKYNLSKENHKKALDKISNFIKTTKCFIYQRTKDLSKLETNNNHLLEHIYKNI